MSIRRTFRKGETGFTLLEIVIAAVILAIVMTGIAFFFMNIIKMSDRMDDQTKALELCREGIEKLRTMDVISMSDGWQTPSETIQGFTRSVWIDTPYALYPEAKHVRCRMTWTGVDGADSLSLSTIF
ncbi:MAG: type II secretion system GspH family protein [Candidatus Sabulitectum sp.]|nr:type II secretion system GspH family protein [Candidatus Sabulitectum sp.]